MIAFRKRWRLRTLMVLIAVVGLGAAWLRKLPDPGPAYRLQYGDTGERASAAVQLGMLGPKLAKRAEPALEAALSDPEQSVRDCAAWALDQFGSKSPALVKALVKQVEVETVQSLRWGWQGDFDRRVEPAAALARIMPPASTLAPLLVKAMSSPDPWIRFQAATLLHKAIGWSGAPTTAVSPLLLTALQDQEFSIRQVFIDDLARFDDDFQRRAAAILLQRLQSPDPPDALEAAVMLARLGRNAEPAGVILADRLQIGDLADRSRTLLMLGKLGPLAKPAVPAILKAMKASDAEKRLPGFLNAFWRASPIWLPGAEGVSPDRVDGPGPLDSLREYAQRILGRIDREAERQGVDVFIEMLRADATETRRSSLESLLKFGPNASMAIPALIKLAEAIEGASDPSLSSETAFLTFRAISEVGNGDDLVLVEALIRWLRTGNDAQRTGAALALGTIKPPPKGVVPALIEAMKDRNSVVRSHASTAIGRYHGPEEETARRELLAMMNDPIFWVRINAGQSLASHGEAAAEAIPTIVRLLRTEDSNLRSQAARILGTFGHVADGATGALLAATDDRNEYVRKSADDALNAITPIETNTAAEAIEVLRQGDASQRLAAACDLLRPGSTALEEIPSGTLVESLRSALLDPEPNVRATSAAALGRLGRQAEGATPSLLAAIKDGTLEVRVLSAMALGRVAPGDAKVIEALSLALTEAPDVDLRNAAASGLGLMGPQAGAAAPVMIRALNDRNGTVRVHVIVALGLIGPADGSVAPALKTIAEQNPSTNMRVWAIRALGLLGAKSDVVVPSLLKMLDEADGKLRRAAAYQLGGIRPADEVLPALLARLNDGRPAVRSLAASTLGMFGPEAAAASLPALIRALRDEDDEVRKAALTSLMEFGGAAAPAEAAIREALSDRCPAVRRDADLALQCIAGEAGVGIARFEAW